MSGILVGYTATATGRDALNLGVALARGQSTTLHVVMVRPVDNEFGSASLPYDRSYGEILETQLQEWLDEALAEIPADISAHGRMVSAQSDAGGLLNAAHVLDADAIVIGSRSGGLLRRHRIGSVASALLHSAHVPVALAPTGYRGTGPISRLTAMFGPRRGAADVVGESLATVRHRGIPLRLVSLVLLDQVSTTDAEQPDVIASVSRYADERLALEAAELVDAGLATVETSVGRSVEDAIRHLDWETDEIIVVGSSRLASRGHLFLGRTASRMLRAATVPIVVIPGHYTAALLTSYTEPEG